MPTVTVETMEQRAAVRAAMPDPLDVEGLYRSHAGAVEHWAARMTGPWLDLEDIVQEVFLIAQRQLPKFRGDSSPATWLFGITERVVWHRRRKERWRRWLAGSADDVAGHLPSRNSSPLEALERKDATRVFYRALEGVSERYRSVLVLFELDNMPGHEIAALKGVRLETLWVWLHRARAQLLKRFVELEGGAS
jgi:RNA polymerase sigma-70 factor, ECF subfamily